ncbi:MAG: hypothetical protein ACSHXK_13185 [Oceanococcus sp.]
MNLDKLKQAEADFLNLYPGGFLHEDMQAIGKKHKVDQRVAEAQAAFSADAFDDVDAVVDAMVQLVSRSSMVSMFEKPKFRDAVKIMDSHRREHLASGLYAFLHGDQQAGFEAMLEVLSDNKLAKWSLMTILPNYYAPNAEVFVKPTTAKGVIAQFELKGVEYRPRPSWQFYTAYREQILSMRALSDPSLAPNNAAFCGFLMMTSK